MGATHVDARKETKSVEICEELLKRYRKEGDQFLLNIVTGDESWIHHFDPTEKRLSMQYRHTSSPRPKKFKTVVLTQEKKFFLLICAIIVHFLITCICAFFF
jgi:hypothetical protein